MTEEDYERVRGLVAAVPPGSVTTYGDVAAAAGLPSARMVATVLRLDGADLPWHRVVRADGRCAPQVAEEQLARLRAEGVRAHDGRLDLGRRRHGFDG